jgi:long-chain acyl-CoA synthetase
MADVPEDPRVSAARVGMLPARWAELLPDELAVISEYGDRTWSELNGNANQLVRALRRRGVHAGDGLALLCGNRPEFIETYVAAIRGGLRLTPINWHLTADEAGYILDDCEAKVFVTDARFADVALAAVERAPGVSVELSIGGDLPGFEPYGDALAAEDVADIDDPMIGTTMLYTSGTTGRPKGVHRDPATAEALAVEALTATAILRAGEHRSLCTGPLYHAAPLALSLAAPLAGGVGIVLMDSWDAEETLRLIDEWEITHTHLVPTMFHRLVSLPDDVKERYDVSSLVFVLHGAAPCPVPVKQAVIDWWGPIVHEYYAATEGAGTLVLAPQWLERPGTVGKPSTGDHVRILDDEGADLPAGEVGYVYLKAPGTSRFEYFKDGGKTESAYRGDYFTLGDYGYLDDDGWLFLTDRSAHLIISGGVNIYPAEVEAVLLTHPAVGDVGVIGVPDDEMGERVIAVIETQPGIEPSDALASELLAFCRDRLAHYKCPRQVVFDDDLPRQDNGKLYKHELRDRYRTLLA